MFPDHPQPISHFKILLPRRLYTSYSNFRSRLLHLTHENNPQKNTQHSILNPLTSEHDPQQGQYIRMSESAHYIHLPQEILFGLPGRRLLQHLDCHHLHVITVFSVQFPCKILVMSSYASYYVMLI